MNTPNEQHIMELAAISTASIQNTRLTIKDRITKENPYWTVAYGDVCNAVDREMNHRQNLEKMEAILKRIMALCEQQHETIEDGVKVACNCLECGLKRTILQIPFENLPHAGT